jgi:hypothetical protein
MPPTALYVKPRSLLLPRPGGQGSGSMETGTFWGGYRGGEQPALVTAVASPADARA